MNSRNTRDPLRSRRTPDADSAPFRGEQAPAGANPPSARPGVEIEPARPLKILVAEDVPADQSRTGAILEERGHRVTHARNGRDALAAYSLDRFDAILLDVQMPEVDGLQAAAAIRELEKQSQRGTPIVAMTDFAMQGDRERCLAAGVDTVIVKPIQTQEMVELLERLGADRARRASSRVVDLSAALERLEGDVDLMEDLVRLFLNHRDDLMHAIEKSILEGSGDQLCRSAHRLKGFVANFDSEAATRTAFRLESMGRDGDLMEAGPTFERLKEQIAEVTGALESFLSRTRG